MTTQETITRIAKMPARRAAKSARATVALVALILIIASLIRPTGISLAEDTIFRLASALGHPKPPSNIAIVAIDDRSIKELGSWPWPRSTFIQLLERLRQQNAGLIVIDSRIASDMGLSELRLPIRRDGGPDYVVGYDFFPTLAEMPAESKVELEDKDRELREAADKIAFPTTPADDAPLPAMAGIRINRFSAADRLYIREGFGNIFPDQDNVVRYQPLAARLRHRVYPALPLVAAAQWRGFTPILAQDAQGRPSGMIIGQERIETGDDARLAINFLGKPGTFDRISAADIQSGQAKAESIEGRLLIVGLTSPMFKAYHRTPLGRMQDVEILANCIGDIIENKALKPISGKLSAALLLALLGFLYAFVFSKLSPRAQVAGTAVIVAICIVGGTLGILFWRAWLPAMQLASASIIFLATTLTWRLIKYEAPRQRLKHAWRGRIRMSAIDAAASDPAVLSGALRPVSVTALSVDIKGFGALMESLPPVQLAEFLREYRRAVSDSCTAEGGFIESLSGDECTAIFGMPIRTPNHALAAIAAAMRIRRRIAASINDFEQDFGIEHVRLSIGIHSGHAVAGDTGAGGTGFGIAGPAIEAAAQLRALCRLYRSVALVGDGTHLATEAAYAYRPLDPLLLCGEKNAATIYELIGEMGTILPQLESFLSARDAYLGGDFRLAVELFGDLLRTHPYDGPSRLLIKRAIHLAEHPPAAPWSGVWTR